MARWRPGAMLLHRGGEPRLPGRPLMNDPDGLDGNRLAGVDQSRADVGQREAKVTDRTRLVGHRLSLVHGPKELSEGQRGDKTSRVQPSAQDCCAQSAHSRLAQSCATLRHSPPHHNRAG